MSTSIHADILNNELFNVELPKYRGVTLREYTVSRLTCLKKEEESIDAVINIMLDEREREKKGIGESS